MKEFTNKHATPFLGNNQTIIRLGLRNAEIKESGAR